MFNFLRKKEPFEPLDYEARKYFENNFLWLIQEFPEPRIEDRKIFVPIKEDFPIEWNQSRENAFQALEIICTNMQIDSNDIDLEFHENGLKEINMGTSVIFINTDDEHQDAAGLYNDKNERDKFPISLDEALLKKPDALISTIAHELAHVKLLGEKQLEFNDEMLTDFTTVFFGFGIFSANTSFQFYNQSDRWGYSKLGYLKAEEWAYALALFAFIRHEDDPHWSTYLSPMIKSDFQKSLQYMINNEDEIFSFNDEHHDI